MTSRLLYEGVLIELNKENAPNILLEDFNYFANKAINNYVNKRYNIYDINQQTTDDLRVLKATAMLKPRQITDYNGLTMAGKDKMATYEVIMPSDYLHILNCICVYKVKKTYKCYNAGDTWRSPATRLTADMYSLVLDNFWNKPTYKKPYYYIHNVNSVNDTSYNNKATIPTNPYNKKVYGKDIPLFLLLGESPILYAYYKDTLYYFENDSNDKLLYVNGMLEDDENNLLEVSGTTGLTGVTPQRIATINGEQFDLSLMVKDNIRFFSSKQHFDNYINNQPENLESGTDVNSVVTTEKYKNNPNGYNDTSTYNYGKDGMENPIVLGKGLPDTITVSINGTPQNVSNRERGQALRYGNVSLVRLEIRYGTDISVFELTDVYVDYIKAPQNIRLTQEEIDLTEDTSLMLEYPDYVCQEIINELVHLVMENISDLRLQTHPVVSLSIANPAQALAPETAGQSARQ